MKIPYIYILTGSLLLLLFTSCYLVQHSHSVLKRLQDNRIPHFILSNGVPQVARWNSSRISNHDHNLLSNPNNHTDTEDYAASLAEKDRRRKAFLQKWIATQEELRLYPTNSTRYVIFYPTYSGIGNTLAVLAEAIVLSWITNRRLRIHKYPAFEQYFTLPLKDYSYEDANFTSRGSLSSGLTCKVPPERIPLAPNRNIILQTTCKFIDFFTSSDRYSKFLDQNGFILHPKLNDPNDIRKTLYHFIYNEVIQVHPDIPDFIEGEKERLEWKKYYWIGVQIRTGHMPGDETLNTFMNKNDLEMFSMYAEQQTAIAKANHTTKPIKWFIATDNEEIREQMVDRYPDLAVISGCEIRHSFRDVERRERSNGMMCTLLDNFLLSSCNELIITARSTYGILASFRNPSIKKLMVYRGDWRKYKRQQQLSSQK